MYAPDNLIPMLYADARRLIRDGDILLYWVDPPVWYKPWTWVKPSTFLITTIGKSTYVHAGMAVRGVGSQVILVDTIQWLGGRRVNLADQVRQYPGCWVVYRPHQPYDGEAAAREMLKVVDRPYGWRNLFVSSLRHTWITSYFLPPFTDDALNGSAPFCSQAASNASRKGGGRDPRPGHADIATEPGHLSHPDYSQPICRLYWDRIPEAEQ